MDFMSNKDKNTFDNILQKLSLDEDLNKTKQMPKNDMKFIKTLAETMRKARSN